MVASLVPYAYCTNARSSRAIEPQCCQDIARWKLWRFVQAMTEDTSALPAGRRARRWSPSSCRMLAAGASAEAAGEHARALLRAA
ncbi:MAG: hypothetical protein ACYC91_19465 [Solirubrobacteraceae bacterium]